MSCIANTSYLFLPFSYQYNIFSSVIDICKQDNSWELAQDEIKYMLKFVADKIDCNNLKGCQCFHFRLTQEGRNNYQLHSPEDWFSTESHIYREHETCFKFQVLSVELYLFSTCVGILAFKVHFCDDDPLWISNALYHLKKVSREQIHINTRQFTMQDCSKNLVEGLQTIKNLSFFYYANPSTERANVLTYIEVGCKDDYTEELFYLRRCYSEGFLYSANKEDEDEIYCPSKDIVWGLSPEAAVCLACPNRGRESFIKGTFSKNFNAQYLFMYVLLLHQKYVLYLLLTKIGVGIYNNLETLEEYRHQLYEFETDFVFSCVTEVPQYQILYDRMANAFALKKMFEDVREPLVSLRDVRRETAEKDQKKRDDSVNRALLILSILSFFSALVDSFDFVHSFFGWFFNETVIRLIQVACIASIFVMLIYVFMNLLRSKKQ